MDELLKHYDQGLPRDPFADWRTSSYSMSDTEPPLIWSFGPDQDQVSQMRSTNFYYYRDESGKRGTVISTEIETESIEEPGEEEGETGISANPDAENHFTITNPRVKGALIYSFNGRGMFIYGDSLPDQPSYDPTNGIRSAGNIYLDPQLYQRLLSEE